jgi:hypothetical protein
MDVASRKTDREAATNVQASRLKLAAPFSQKNGFELPVAKGSALGWRLARDSKVEELFNCFA